MKRLLFLLATLTLAGCDLNNTGPKYTPSNPETETFAASLGVDIASMTATEANPPDYYKDIVVGTGEQIDGDAYVAFTYVGYLKDGSKFDEGTIELEDHQRLVGTSAQAGLIIGLADALQGMRVGGHRLTVIRSDYAYQNSSITTPNGVIPANSTLIFDVTLNGLEQIP